MGCKEAENKTKKEEDAEASPYEALDFDEEEFYANKRRVKCFNRDPEGRLR
jgi:hypothetical protein